MKIMMYEGFRVQLLHIENLKGLVSRKLEKKLSTELSGWSQRDKDGVCFFHVRKVMVGTGFCGLMTDSERQTSNTAQDPRFFFHSFLEITSY